MNNIYLLPNYKKRMHRFDTPSKIAIDSWIIASCVGAKKRRCGIPRVLKK